MKFSVVFGLICYFCGLSAVFAQSLYHSPIAFEKEPKETFSFTRNWAYPWNVIKDNNGKFSKADDGEIIAADTSHLYFTANCKTNVQGGYSIRYCSAIKKGENVNLNFFDGLPAYGSEFNVILSKNVFSFKPRIVYPELKTDDRMHYKVIREKLVIYQKNYPISKMISGYIDAEFTETALDAQNRRYLNKYYFRGYFKTAVKT